MVFSVKFRIDFNSMQNKSKYKPFVKYISLIYVITAIKIDKIITVIESYDDIAIFIIVINNYYAIGK